MEHSPVTDSALLRRMLKYGIREEDIEEHFIRSDGKGGQKVNKTSTAVYLKHIPTGIEVKCRIERSQGLNRTLARMILTDKIEAKKLAAERKAKEVKEKIRRMKSPRPPSIKRKILRDKHFNALKKKNRSWDRQSE